MKIRLTKRTVDAQRSRKTEYWVADETISGFGLRVFPSGVKSFVYRYRWRGERRIRVIGIYGQPHGAKGKPLTADRARTQAEILHGLVKSGVDPNATSEWDNQALTVSHLCDSYLADVRAGKILTRRGQPKSETTIATDRGRIERHIKPLLGRKKVKIVTRADIERFRDAVASGATRADVKTGKHGRAIVKGGSGTASRTMGLLGAIFAYAEKKMMREGNPVYGVDRTSDNKRLRSLSSTDYAVIGKAIDQLKGTSDSEGRKLGTEIALEAIRALLLTGCRKSEIISLKKSEFDASANCLRLQETKTGAQVRPIGNAAVEHIASQDWNDKSAFVFPASRGQGHIVGVPKVWNKIRAATSLNDVSLHTFRHGFASVAAELGYSELTIAGLLGHSSGSVTARYAHIVDGALVAAADRVSAEIDRRLGGSTSGNVVQLRG